MRLLSLAALVTLSLAQSEKRCECTCPPDGTKFAQLINCFATWGTDVAHAPYNSKLDSCNDKEIQYCRTTNTFDLFCRFDGTNNLIRSEDTPYCYFNCGMLSCDAWLIGHDEHERNCIKTLYKDE